jgi:tol-pal system protein YbgF
MLKLIVGLLFIITLLLPMWLYAQEVDTVSAKDRDFYLYSIEQLNSANQGFQEQLLENEQLIARLRVENDSLRILVDSLRKALIALPILEAEAEPSPAPEPTLNLGDTGYEEAYRQALEIFNQREYSQALALFQSLLERDRKNSLADNCQYWIGECFYAKKDYQRAILEFEKVFSFPKANKDDDAQLKIGLCYLRMNDKESAQRELTRLLSNYPNSEFAGTARKLLTESQTSK